MTALGTEPATFRLVTQCLNQLRTASPQVSISSVRMSFSFYSIQECILHAW